MNTGRYQLDRTQATVSTNSKLKQRAKLCQILYMGYPQIECHSVIRFGEVPSTAFYSSEVL